MLTQLTERLKRIPLGFLLQQLFRYVEEETSMYNRIVIGDGRGCIIANQDQNVPQFNGNIYCQQKKSRLCHLLINVHIYWREEYFCIMIIPSFLESTRDSIENCGSRTRDSFENPAYKQLNLFGPIKKYLGGKHWNVCVAIPKNAEYEGHDRDKQAVQETNE